MNEILLVFNNRLSVFEGYGCIDSLFAVPCSYPLLLFHLFSTPVTNSPLFLLCKIDHKMSEASFPEVGKNKLTEAAEV